MEDIILQDQQLFLFLNHLGTDRWDSFWLFMTNKWSGIPLYLLLVYGLVREAGWKAAFFTLIFIALLITTTDQLANFFKYGLERLRPCHEQEIVEQMRLVKSYCGGKFGFFSAHAASSMGLASFFVWKWYPKYPWIMGMLFWAFLVGYSRIYIGVHYPGDVVFGWLVGAFFGWLYFRLFQLSRIKKDTN